VNLIQEISTDEILRVSRVLESHHVIFYKLWDMGKPILSEDIPTACVKFDRSGTMISFEFNPKLWDSLNDYERAFVISHECLHVILNHGSRVSSKKSNEDQIINIAMDVAVNEMLLDGFGFELDKLPNCPKLCICDTVFNEKNVSKDKSFEYYLNKIREDNSSNDNLSPLDIHEFLQNIGQDVLDQIAESIYQDTSISQNEIKGFLDSIKNVDKNINGEDLNGESGGLRTGSVAGKLCKMLSVERVKTYKRKWLDIVSKLSKSILKSGMKTDEQWLLKPRRLSAIKSDFFLPFEHEEVHMEQDRFNAWFFLDCSGSCYEHANKFFNATKAVPHDHFDTKIFTFDTSVKEVKKNATKLYGFGGTSFSCIERYIQSQLNLNDKLKYPDLVFILTDGWGDLVNPQYPKRWIWINTTESNNYIPKNSKVIKYKELYFD
jgi:hypothetical protein